MDLKQSDIDIPFRKISVFNKILWEVYGGKLFFLKFLFRFCLNLNLPKSIKKNKIRIPHPYNIVINSNAEIGYNVTIYHNVSLGSMSFGHKTCSPKIKENVIIYPQTSVIGNIEIGENSIIGAGAVVVKNFPPYSVIAGNPAKIIGRINKE